MSNEEHNTKQPVQLDIKANTLSWASMPFVLIFKVFLCSCFLFPIPCGFVVGSVINLAKAKSALPVHFWPIPLQAKVRVTIEQSNSQMQSFAQQFVQKSMWNRARNSIEGSMGMLNICCYATGHDTWPQQEQLAWHITDFSDKVWAAGSPGTPHWVWSKWRRCPCLQQCSGWETVPPS